MREWIWTSDSGLREINAREAGDKAAHLVREANRCKWYQRKEKARLMAQAAKSFKDKDEATAAEKADGIKRKEINEEILAEKGPTRRREILMRQAREEWGPRWRPDEDNPQYDPSHHLSDWFVEPDKPVQTFSDPDRLADDVDPDRLGG